MTATNVRVGDIALVNPRLGSPLGEDQPVSFLGMADVTEDGRTNQGMVRTYGEVKKGYTAFLDGDLLVAKITPCFENGKIAQASLGREVGFGSTEFHVVRPQAGIADPRYLLHLLRGPEVRLAGEKRMTGSAGQKRVPRSFLESLEIPLPPLPEQRRIAAILDQADELRVKRRRTLTLLDELADSIFMERCLSNCTLMTLKDAGVRFSSGKSVVALGDIAKHASNRVLKTSSVSSGVFDPRESKPLPEQYSAPANHRVSSGDLLFTRASGSVNLIGVSAFATEPLGDLFLPDKIWRVELGPAASVNNHFLNALFRQPQFRAFVENEASGASGVRNISQSKVLSFVAPIPSIAVQREFAQRILAIASLRGVGSRRLAVLDELFASLQHRAFRGEL